MEDHGSSLNTGRDVVMNRSHIQVGPDTEGTRDACVPWDGKMRGMDHMEATSIWPSESPWHPYYLLGRW